MIEIDEQSDRQYTLKKFELAEIGMVVGFFKVRLAFE